MNKLKAFIKSYKYPIMLTFCFIFAISASLFTTNEVPESEPPTEVEETRAFITKGNDSPTDKTRKKETIEVMPEEKVIPDNSDKETTPDKTESENVSPPVTPEISEEKISSEPNFITPVSGKRTKHYSVSPIYYEITDDWRSHEGIDIASESAEEVASAEEGTVTFVGKDPFLGITVKISHKNGFETQYSNLHSDTTVIEGQVIEKGHIIGYIGESSLLEANDTPHLHFELFKNGKRVNPEEYLQ